MIVQTFVIINTKMKVHPIETCKNICSTANNCEEKCIDSKVDHCESNCITTCVLQCKNDRTTP